MLHLPDTSILSPVPTTLIKQFVWRQLIVICICCQKCSVNCWQTTVRWKCSDKCWQTTIQLEMFWQLLTNNHTAGNVLSTVDKQPYSWKCSDNCWQTAIQLEMFCQLLTNNHTPENVLSSVLLGIFWQLSTHNRTAGNVLSTVLLGKISQLLTNNCALGRDLTTVDKQLTARKVLTTVD